jgi:hypothetical protein
MSCYCADLVDVARLAIDHIPHRLSANCTDYLGPSAMTYQRASAPPTGCKLLANYVRYAC